MLSLLITEDQESGGLGSKNAPPKRAHFEYKHYRLLVCAVPLALIMFFIIFFTPTSMSNQATVQHYLPAAFYQMDDYSIITAASEYDLSSLTVEELYNDPKSPIYALDEDDTAEGSSGVGSGIKGKRQRLQGGAIRLPPRPLGNNTDGLGAAARLVPRWEKKRFHDREVPITNNRDFRIEIPAVPYDWNERPSALFGLASDREGILAEFPSASSEEVNCTVDTTHCVDGPMKASWRRPPASLSVTSYDNYRNIRIRFGILTVAQHVETRLFPMLNTTLKDAQYIDIFLRKTPYSHAVAAYIRAVVRTFHPFASTVRVVELYGPNNSDYKSVATRNAWINLEAMRFWYAELLREGAATIRDSDSRHRPHWYSVLDDDGYIFVENAKAYLFDLERSVLKQKKPLVFDSLEKEAARRRDELVAYREKFRAERRRKASENEAGLVDAVGPSPDDEESIVNAQYPLTLSPKFRQQYEGLDHSLGEHVGPLLTGNTFGVKVRVRAPKPPKKVKKPNHSMEPHSTSNSMTAKNSSNDDYDDGLPYRIVLEVSGQFANGGPGYYFNRAALETAGKHYESCFNKYRFDRSGDVIISQCMIDHGVALYNRRNLCNEAFGVCLARDCHRASPYPVASHRNIGYKALHMARALYEARFARGELVHWGDIERHYPVDFSPK